MNWQVVVATLLALAREHTKAAGGNNPLISAATRKEQDRHRTTAMVLNSLAQALSKGIE